MSFQMKLALYTFGVFARPSTQPENDDFHFLNDLVLPQVDRAAGLIARSGYDGEAGPASWGTQVFPKFYEERGDGYSPSTLSLWVDAESAMAFSYSGLHAQALKRGREWFVKPQWPPYAVWWVASGHVPEWAEAVWRHQHLHDHGPTSEAFTFKQSFDSAGRAMAIDAQKVKAIAQKNVEILG